MQKRASRIPIVARVVATVGMVAYPLLVWRGLTTGSPRQVSLVMVALFLPAAYFRLRSIKGADLKGLVAVPVVTLACLGLASILNQLDFILAVPIAVSSVFLGTFGVTLRPGSRSMVERFARLQEPALIPEKQAWCRLWTKIWCVFFVLNAITAGILGWLAPLEWWALYTGLISYVLTGIVFGVEVLLRMQKFPEAKPQGGA
jgi:uncharacterized membrane protein